jgi:hypothetical protein
VPYQLVPFTDGIDQDRDLSQNLHFFEENRQKQGRFVPDCQKLSVGVKICQSTTIDLNGQHRWATDFFSTKCENLWNAI